MTSEVAPRTVLLVEDEPAHVELMLEAFADVAWDGEVRPVGTAREARAALQDAAWDLVIIDWRLPDGDGLALLEEYRRGTGAPFMIMTSHGDERLAVAAMRAGAVDYVVKSSAALLDLPHTAARAIREHRQAQELAATQQALRQSQADYAAIVRCVPDIIYRLDPDGRITFVSHAVTRYGYEPDELLGRSILDIVAPEDRDGVRRRLAERRTGDRANNLSEFRLISKRHEDERSFEIHSQPFALPVMQAHAEGLYQPGVERGPDTFLGTQGIARDITDWREQDQRLRQLDIAIRNSRDIHVILDGEGRICYANPAYETLSGRPPETVLGTLWHEHHQLVTLEDEQAVRAYLAGGAPWTWRGGVRLGADRLAVVDLSATPLQEAGSLRGGFVIRATDVSDVARLEDQLQQAARLESLATLAGGVAHDFNNVLAAISGYVELALMDIDAESRAAGDLDHVLQATHRAADLTRQVLTFARRDESHLAPLQAGPVVREALHLLRASLPPSVAVRERIAGDLPLVLADATKLHRVVMNLCTNASHAIGDHPGTITVRLERQNLAEARAVRGRVLPPGEYLQLSIEDDGCGMPAEVRARIFEPFYTTKPAGAGTGLGLSMVHGIVAEHQGVIEVESVVGRGTSFTILLPGCDELESAELDDAEVLSGEGRVLVVDDESGLARMFERQLVRAGYTVAVTNDPLDALGRLLDLGEPCDVLVTDLLMPGLSGVELLRRVREQRPQLPALVVTGFASEEQTAAALALGRTRLLRKPIRMDVLVATVAALLRDAGPPAGDAEQARVGLE